MSFAPGVSGNPHGRPPKSRRWADVGYWGQILENNINDLDAKERIALAKWAMELLTDKRKEVPAAKDEKAQDTDAILKALEKTSNPVG